MLKTVLDALGLSVPDELSKFTDKFLEDMSVYKDLAEHFSAHVIQQFKIILLAPLLKVWTFFAWCVGIYICSPFSSSFPTIQVDVSRRRGEFSFLLVF